MKTVIAWVGAALVILGGAALGLADDLRDKVRVEVERTTVQPGMEPGSYVCSLGHLHVRANVQNLADVPVGGVKVVGRAFDAGGKLLGTATATTGQATIGPGQKMPLDLEFLTITGPLIRQVKREELTVLEVQAK